VAAVFVSALVRRSTGWEREREREPCEGQNNVRSAPVSFVYDHVCCVVSLGSEEVSRDLRKQTKKTPKRNATHSLVCDHIHTVSGRSVVNREADYHKVCSGGKLFPQAQKVQPQWQSSSHRGECRNRSRRRMFFPTHSLRCPRTAASTVDGKQQGPATTVLHLRHWGTVSSCACRAPLAGGTATQSTARRFFARVASSSPRQHRRKARIVTPPPPPPLCHRC
jgi:hypothetical protein